MYCYEFHYSAVEEGVISELKLRLMWWVQKCKVPV